MQVFDIEKLSRTVKKAAIQCAYNWLYNHDLRTPEEIQARAESDTLDALYNQFEPLPEDVVKTLVKIWINMYNTVITQLNQKPSAVGIIAKNGYGRIISS